MEETSLESPVASSKVVGALVDVEGNARQMDAEGNS